MDYTVPKDLHQSLLKPRGPCASIAHHPSEGAPTCPCPVGPEPSLRVVVGTHPFGTHSPREPGQCWGYSGNQPLSLLHRLPVQKEADKFNTRAKASQSQNNRVPWGREGRCPMPELSLEIGAQAGGQHPGRGRASTRAHPGDPNRS